MRNNDNVIKLKLLDIVSLVSDDPEHGVRKGYKGTIVDIHSDGEAYTVEFVDEEGNCVEKALFTEYQREDLILLRPAR